MPIITTFDLITLLTGILIFCARVIDVSLGTLRTISIVQGKTQAAFSLEVCRIKISTSERLKELISRWVEFNNYQYMKN